MVLNLSRKEFFLDFSFDVTGITQRIEINKIKFNFLKDGKDCMKIFVGYF